MNEKGKSTIVLCNDRLKYFNYASSTSKPYLNYIKEFTGN